MRKKTLVKINILTLITFTLLTVLISCDKNVEYIELTEGRSMDPRAPRYGIKITNEDDAYLCIEKMASKEGSFALGYHTGKYEFYKSKEKINFSEVQSKILINYSKPVKKVKIVDATFENITFKFDKNIHSDFFYYSQLNSEQRETHDEIWKLKNSLEFEKTDSVYFNQNLLQEKLPEPPLSY